MVARPSLRKPFLCVLALVLLISGIGASRAAAGIWVLNGEPMIAGLFPTVAANEVEGSGLTLTSQVESIKVEVQCTGLVLEKFALQEAGLVSSGKARLSGCTTKLNGKKQVACEPHNGTEKGVIVTNTLSIAVTPHASGSVIKVEGPSSVLAIVALSEECLVGEEIPLIGTLSLKDTGFEKEAGTHLVSNGPLTELWLVSKTAEHSATVGGSATISLSGAHAGMPWTFSGENPNWRVNGTSISAKLLPQLQVKELESKTLSFLGKFVSTEYELSCTAATFSNMRLKAEGKIEGGQITFSGCIVTIAGTVSKGCSPPGGVLVTPFLKGLVALHEGVGIVRLSPTEGTTFLAWTLSEACSLGGTVSITGSIALKDTSLATEAVSHLFAADSLTSLVFFSRPMTLSGSALFSLSGEHTGLKWSAWPG
jgi:hypothetical protein